MRRVVWLCLLAVSALVAGCDRREPKPLPSSTMHAITREMVAAARAASSDHAQVSVQQEEPAAGPGAADRILITLAAEPGGHPATTVLPAIERELDHVARAHRLQRVVRKSSVGSLRFDYQRSNHPTESVEIILPLILPARTANSSGASRLAVIVDDLGNDRAPAEALLALDVPVTFAVLPQLPYSEVVAAEAHARGFEVLLHLPVEPENGESAGSVELKSGMSSSEVNRIVSTMLESVPGATGVNNHEGSRGTADPMLMKELMAELARRHLFFIDSRTTVATVAYDAAVHAGVPAASRNVFLDDTETPAAVRAQLDLAVETARRDGAAIAIGHPHPETMAVLQSELPRLSHRGISLVFASALCDLPSRSERGITSGSASRTAAQVNRASPPPSWPPSAQSRAPK